MSNYKYTIDGLDCAGCALKVENAISNLNEVESATLNFSTKTLSVKSAVDSDSLVPIIEKTIAKVEDGVIIKEYSTVTGSHISHDACSCEHHEHGHHHDNCSCEQQKHKENFFEKYKEQTELAQIIIAVILLAVGFTCKLLNVIPMWSSMLIMAVSAVISGYGIVFKGFKSILKLRFNEDVLTAIAVTAAMLVGEFFEAAMVTILFSIGEMLEEKAVDKSRKNIEKLSQIRPDTARIITENGTQTVDAEKVSIGSEILVNPYERIPIDGKIFEGSSSVDTSALTGESIPQNVEIGDEVMSGMMNINGVLKIRTTKACNDSAAARILHLVEESASKKGNAENFITRFARVYTPIILVLAVFVCAIPPIVSLGSFMSWLNRALVFLVASCPCALVISVPLGFYSGIGACSRIGVLIKGGKYIEALSKAESIAFDKTGTLTSGDLSVTKIISENGYSEDDILKIAAAAEAHSSHPVAQAIKNKASGLKLPILENNTEKAGYGVRAYLDGKEILCGNKKLFNDQTLESGTVFVAINGEIVGKIYVSDTIRPESEKAIKQLKKLGFKHLVMLTGDSEKNAADIAKKCGIDEYRASLLPEDKANAVEELQKSGGVVFVGDGINDAPVLAKADCGFSMGLGSDAAIESSDAVLVGGTLAKLPDAVKLSRRTMHIVRFNIGFALTVKIIILALAVIGVAPMWLAVFADTGVSVLTVLNSARLLRIKKSSN